MNDAADEAAICEIETRYNDAWNRHDPGGMVESLTDDGQFVTVNGVWIKTRAEFLSLWAGQGLRLARRQSAAELMERLRDETHRAIASLQEG